MTTVKIAKIGESTKRITAEGTLTLGGALNEANFNASGFEITINGTKTTDMSTILGDKDSIVLAAQIKGN